MFISRKKLKELEKRVADLEKAQNEPHEEHISPLEVMKAALKENKQFRGGEKDG